MSAGIPAVCFAGWSGEGKTTLITKLLPLFEQDGIRVSVIKHSHHTLLRGDEGHDSFAYSSAGAAQVVVSGENVTMTYQRGQMSLAEAMALVSGADVLLVEGYEAEADIPVIEIRRHDKPLRTPPERIRVLVSDRDDESVTNRYHPDDVTGIYHAVLELLSPTLN